MIRIKRGLAWGLTVFMLLASPASAGIQYRCGKIVVWAVDNEGPDVLPEHRLPKHKLRYDFVVENLKRPATRLNLWLSPKWNLYSNGKRCKVIVGD
jgi:hypothetical protein